MPKVLLIGWDGAGWNHIHPLLDSGAMPNLARMVETGVMGDLRPLTPLCSPLLWTSIATGQFADRHGVLDTQEPDPVTGGVRPVTRASLKATQVWDLLAREGVRCQVTGWPATHPAPGPITCVSDGFAFGIAGSVFPQTLESTLLPLRFRPQEWTGSELQLFVPELARIDQDKDKRLAQLAVTLAEAVSVHAAATTLLESGEWDFSAVWYGVVGRAAEPFMNTADDVYKEVAGGIYRLLDLFLGRLIQLAGPDTVVILVSDRAAGEVEFRGARGILCATGPGIERDELTFGAGLLDVAPTVLGLFGFAPAPEMVGRALAEICAVTPSRQLRSDSGGRSVAQAAPEDSPALDTLQLEDFGYVDTVAAAWRAEAEAAQARRDFHLARVLLSQGRAGEAVPLLEKLAARNPAVFEMRCYLGHAYFQSGRIGECREICEAMLSEAPNSPYAAAGRAHLAIAEGNYAEALSYLASGEQGSGIIASLDAAVGDAYLRIGRPDEAAAAFRSAIQTDPGIPEAHEGLARALLALGQYEAAAETALDAIRLRFDLPGAHTILGRALKALGRDQAAAGALARAEMLSRAPVA
jgi:tetratricopeptide (TPR) repeat protein